MNKTTYSVSAVALAAILLITPPGTAAAEININSETTGALEPMVDLNEIETDASIEVDTSVDAETSTPEMRNAELDSEANLRVGADGHVIITAAEVKDEQDLQAFTYNLAVQDTMVEEAKAETTDDGKARVEVIYKHYGELFGFMPIIIHSTTVVTVGQGQVEVQSNLPWWSLIATKKNHAADEIESRIKDNPTIMTSAEAKADAHTRATIAEAVVAELDAHSYLHTALNQ